MANTRLKRLPGEIVMDAIPRKRGRPRTRPERTTPKRKYQRSGRYSKARKAERAFRKSRKAELQNYQPDMPAFELERRRGGRKGFVTPVIKDGWNRRGRKAKIANIVPSF